MFDIRYEPATLRSEPTHPIDASLLELALAVRDAFQELLEPIQKEIISGQEITIKIEEEIRGVTISSDGVPDHIRALFMEKALLRAQRIPIG